MICLYIYLYIYQYIYVSIYISISISTYIYIYIYIYVCMYGNNRMKIKERVLKVNQGLHTTGFSDVAFQVCTKVTIFFTYLTLSRYHV